LEPTTTALLLEAVAVILFAIGVGTLASMLGIGGGILNTPLLIIVFGVSAQIAPASTLVAALFVAVSSTVAYGRQKPSPILVKTGLLLSLLTVPGTFAGIFLRNAITDDYLLRLIFGVVLFPVALSMLFAKKRSKDSSPSKLKAHGFSGLTKGRLVLSLGGAFSGGIVSGLMGLGGGVLVVPVLDILMAVPMHAAVATSMLTMIFTASSGTILNYVLGQIDLFFSVTLGIGMVIGAQIGSRLARRVDAIRLKQLFGLVLVFPLIKMMRLGQLWLDPAGISYLVSTVGDLIIWLLIVVPIGLVRLVQVRRAKAKGQASMKGKPPARARNEA
jgi:uncharacterized membrane protein YfcA